MYADRVATGAKGTFKMNRNELPVVVIGAGPVGLAAAAHLIERGLDPLVLEAGPSVGTSMREWGHVRLFSPWRYVVDEAAERLLATTGWKVADPEAFPTGQEIVEQYLLPLASHPVIAPRLRMNHRVTAVARHGFDKMKTTGRDDAPFAVTVQDPGGEESVLLARAVVDASGTWSIPNPAGASGVPAIGERAVRGRIVYGLPDVRDTFRARYAGKRVLVVGSGHSAFNVLLDLLDLAADVPGMDITWAVRKPATRLQSLFGGGANDALPARGELGARVRTMVDAGRLRFVTGFQATRIKDMAEGLVVVGEDAVLPAVDEIVVATGFRPDFSFLGEMRLGLDSTVESTVALAPLIDPNLHSCGSVPPHGAEELRHPEPNFFIVGMKSYGRAPTFLMLTGYEQVRSVAAAIDGDWESARDVRLVLPETGVCSTSILADRGVACCPTGASVAEGSACCETAAAVGESCCSNSTPQVVQLNAAIKGRCCDEG